MGFVFEEGRCLGRYLSGEDEEGIVDRMIMTNGLDGIELFAIAAIDG